MPARRSTSTIVTRLEFLKPGGKETTTFIRLPEGSRLLSVFDACKAHSFVEV